MDQSKNLCHAVQANLDDERFFFTPAQRDEEILSVDWEERYGDSRPSLRLLRWENTVRRAEAQRDAAQELLAEVGLVLVAEALEEVYGELLFVNRYFDGSEPLYWHKVLGHIEDALQVLGVEEETDE